MGTRFAAAVSSHPLASHAIGETTGQVLDVVGPGPDLALLFVAGEHVGQMTDLAEALRRLLGPATLVGVSAESVLAADQEIEQIAAVALWAGRIGAAEPFVLPPGAGPGELPDHLGDAGPLVLISDPFSIQLDPILDALAATAPYVSVVGGLASAGRAPGGNRLILDDRVLHSGAVGVVLPAGVRSRAVVSQGCRPVGAPFVVTDAEGNALLSLGGRPANERVAEIVESADDAERAVLARGLHLGIVIDEHKPVFERGDFLVRSVLGIDQRSGAVVVGQSVPVGTTVQFQVRDAASAHHDLETMLAGSIAESALIFTCSGRGLRLFEERNHDAGLVFEHTTSGAVAGMFCAGEIGPVGPRSFLHGFSASVLLLG